MMRFEDAHLVTLVRPLPEHDLQRGDTGIVLDAHHAPGRYRVGFKTGTDATVIADVLGEDLRALNPVRSRG